jgi:hypothetical protein
VDEEVIVDLKISSDIKSRLTTTMAINHSVETFIISSFREGRAGVVTCSFTL